MDTDEQLYETDATGWRRGLYEDVKRTFRAPIVNWIFRTTTANYPEFVRYAWGQLKPAFGTERFGEVSVAYRDRVLSAVDAEAALPRYRREGLEISPAELAELRGQIATYDVVAPRLATLFEIVDRSLSGGSVGGEFDGSRAATAPLPPWLDRDRGRPPTLAGFEAAPPGLGETLPAIRAAHGLGEGLPSVYRTLAQWPGYLGPAWADVGPVIESSDFEAATAAAGDVVDGYVDSLSYTPALSPADLEARGFDPAVIEDLADLFAEFNRGPIETVLPALPLFAYTLDAEGRRTLG
jgi:hypothetical protein